MPEPAANGPGVDKMDVDQPVTGPGAAAPSAAGGRVEEDRAGRDVDRPAKRPRLSEEHKSVHQPIPASSSNPSPLAQPHPSSDQQQHSKHPSNFPQPNSDSHALRFNSADATEPAGDGDVEREREREEGEEEMQVEPSSQPSEREGMMIFPTPSQSQGQGHSQRGSQLQDHSGGQVEGDGAGGVNGGGDEREIGTEVEVVRRDEEADTVMQDGVDIRESAAGIGDANITAMTSLTTPNTTNPPPHPDQPQGIEIVAPEADADDADEGEYDDPWFDAACLTATDGNGHILPDEMPVPAIPSTTTPRKEARARRMSERSSLSGLGGGGSGEGREMLFGGMGRLSQMSNGFEEDEEGGKEEKVGAEAGKAGSSMFSIGGKTPPPVSDAARAKVASMFGEDFPPPKGPSSFGIPSFNSPQITNNSNHAESSAQALDREAQDAFSGFSTGFGEGSSSVPAMVGFKTGKGKALAGPSAAAQARIAKIFGDELDTFMPMEEMFKKPMIASLVAEPEVPEASKSGTHDPPPEAMFVTPALIRPMRRDSTASHLETPTKSGEKDQDVDMGVVPRKGGSLFSTAGGAAMPEVSPAAKAAAMAMFAGDADLGKEEDVPEAPQQPTSLFTTGNGAVLKSPTMKAKTLAAKILAEEVPPVEPVSEPIPTTPITRPKLLESTSPNSPNRKRPTGIKDVTNMSSEQSGEQNRNSLPAFTTPVRPGPTPLLNRVASTFRASSPAMTPRVGIGLGMTPRSQSAIKKRPSFKTPFKPGSSMSVTPNLQRVGSGLRTPGAVRRSGALFGGTPKVEKDEPMFGAKPVFDVTRPANRKSMVESEVWPHFYTEQKLLSLGCPPEIMQINPSNACYYHFSIDGGMKGSEDAIKRLKDDGCVRVSSSWVSEHWTMILWKLASLVRAKPDLAGSRWTYEEVVKQLKYRYEREYNHAQRSTIKRIQEQDSPASMPMVLCISAVHVAEQDPAEDSKGPQSLMILELTDGWYRIRASADAPLQRAVNGGRLAVGYKIAISGARLDASKEGTDVLDALDKSTLRITGNSTSLAAWDHKLGFAFHPFIAGMSSLSSDGGSVALMAVKIVKMYPLAFMSKEKVKGVAPWTEAEEFAMKEQWNQRYTQERDRLQQSMKDGLRKLEDDLERLRQACEGIEVDAASVNDEDLHDDVLEQYHQTAQKAAFIRTLSPSSLLVLLQKANEEFGWECRSRQGDMEQELQESMPPRATRSFQVCRLEDVFPNSRGNQRTAQLQIWDAKQLEQGMLREGNTYLVSNLQPTQPHSWTNFKEKSGEIFLCTNRNTTWRRLE